MGKTSWDKSPPQNKEENQDQAFISKTCEKCFYNTAPQICSLQSDGPCVHQYPGAVHVNLSKLKDYVWRNFPLWIKRNMLNLIKKHKQLQDELWLEEFSSLEEEEYAQLDHKHRHLQYVLCPEEFSSLEEHEYAQLRYIDEREKVLEN